ncbi:relaxase/mobilization nuclease domain-containing protein [Maridesulfovibrio sp.]|uniref:relaxase/mobilization nuclease domain-containing protein n=1 Tax=Maridesulfovibrio sp. TaxID=2795000 RepID=UPI0029F5C367|nr:relaxase/mobilization nuclease domain-containing protein [Maridesulfovibrio sp.]
MLMKVFRHGVGRGAKVVEYVTGKKDSKRKENPPEVLRGDPDSISALIDTTTRKWRYTSGVLSWAPKDKVTPADERKLMDSFESYAFAGLEPNQYSILWVRHSHAGHHEMHFVIPRTELRTDKALNPCPPGWEKQYNPWCELHNRRHNWARPDEMKRARLVSPGSSIQSYKSGNASEIRRTVTEAIVQGVEAGLIHNRQDIVRTLEEFGFGVPRQGKEYITIELPENDKSTVSQKRKNRRIRLKGVLYARSWTAEQFKKRAELSRENEGADGRTSAKLQADNSRRIAELEKSVSKIRQTRAEYHRNRYKNRDRRTLENSTNLNPRYAPLLEDPRRSFISGDNRLLSGPSGRDSILDRSSGNNPSRTLPEDRTPEDNREKARKLGSNAPSGQQPQIHSSASRDKPEAELAIRKPSRHFTQGLSHERITEELIGRAKPNRRGTGTPIGRTRSKDSQTGKGNTGLPGLAERIGASFERIGKISSALVQKIMNPRSRKKTLKAGINKLLSR